MRLDLVVSLGFDRDDRTFHYKHFCMIENVQMFNFGFDRIGGTRMRGDDAIRPIDRRAVNERSAILERYRVRERV